MDDKGSGCEVGAAETKHAAALARLKEALDNENAISRDCGPQSRTAVEVAG